MITGLARLFSKGILLGVKGAGKATVRGGVLAGKGAMYGGAYASKVPYWFAKKWVGLPNIEDKMAMLGNVGIVYKRNKRRWHDALNAGELIHPYNY